MISLNRLISERIFRRLALLTVVSVYLLIAVGGIVRSTGSGMGCPDWPKCFGQWIPPTDVSQLPDDYQLIYSHRGYANTEFNVFKTWTEYLNRLLGVLIGILIFFTSILAIIAYWRTDRVIVGYSFLAFLLVCFQGWLGARVVFSVLSTWLITLHMLLAIVIVSLLVYVMVRSQADIMKLRIYIPPTLNKWLLLSSFLLLTQILLGTQVREMVDEVAKRFGENARDQWIIGLGIQFYIHRSFSLLVFGSQIVWSMLVIKYVNHKSTLRKLAIGLLALLVIEIVTGVVMAYFGIPAWAQPVHLVLAVFTLGIQFFAILIVNRDSLLLSRKLHVAHNDQM
jgi:heme a synthase